MGLRKLLAIRAFATDYHSGQWSRGYKILSLTYLRLQHKPLYLSGDQDALLSYARRTSIYKTLVERYKDKI